MTLHRILVVVILLAAPHAVAAQEVDSTAPVPNFEERARASDAERFKRMVVPAALGSGAGLVAGVVIGSGPFYDATGCCGGGDDPGLLSALWGAFIGATAGSALGAYITNTSAHPVSFKRALTGATVGIATGLLMGIAGAEFADADPRGLVIGFAIGQGITTAGFAVKYP